MLMAFIRKNEMFHSYVGLPEGSDNPLAPQKISMEPQKGGGWKMIFRISIVRFRGEQCEFSKAYKFRFDPSFSPIHITL